MFRDSSSSSSSSGSDSWNEKDRKNGREGKQAKRALVGKSGKEREKFTKAKASVARRDALTASLYEELNERVFENRCHSARMPSLDRFGVDVGGH